MVKVYLLSEPFAKQMFTKRNHYVFVYVTNVPAVLQTLFGFKRFNKLYDQGFHQSKVEGKKMMEMPDIK